MNRLANETSPYLRQHADNPVHWWPWGPEALAEAERTDRPILVSVGYSACHWCHVMAHESFEDPEVADAMNRTFVNVKVDREERPDVDSVYMEAVQAMTGRGGWPMTVVCLPDGRPFFGGTYFPKPSFLQLIARIDELWNDRRGDLAEQAAQLTAALGSTALLAPAGAVPGVDALNAALGRLADSFDPEWGGFGGAPKFPQTMSLDLCLRAHHASGGEGAMRVVATSLDAMASGGIYDHLGGGFARYSVDSFWMVPHFEKMLYDQALLARVYLHGWQVTGNPAWRQVVAETIGYVLRDLRLPEGGLASAEDADSLDAHGHSEEGAFSTWRPEEIVEVLGDDLAPAAITWWGVTASGNFEGRNILHRPVRGDLMRPPEIERARGLLFEARATRPRPGLDDKVITEWNALMISTIAEAGAATATSEWLGAAEALAEFLVANLRPNGRWLRTWQRDGGARHLAVAADLAALVDAFTRLAEATGRARWIEWARTTAEELLEQHWDAEAGGLFMSAHDAEPLVARPKDVMDNATPSANSLAAVALDRLGVLTGVERYRERAEAILRLLGPVATEHPSAFGMFLAAVDQRRAGLTEVVIVGDRPDLVAAVHQRYLPNVVLAWGEPYESPLWDGRVQEAAYVCEHYACHAPVSTPDALVAQLTPAASGQPDR